MAHDVFICYSSKDKTTADAVCAVLESEGLRCWIAPRDILVGMSYGEAIVDAIHNAKALVLVFSGHANASPQIEREVERAINQRIPVIPLRIEDVAPDKALEYFLSTPHWLDAFTPPLERHLRYLAAQIRKLINKEPPTPRVAAEEATGDAAPAAVGASPFKTVRSTEAAASAPPATPPPSTPAPAPEPPKGEAAQPRGASPKPAEPSKPAAAVAAFAGTGASGAPDPSPSQHGNGSAAADSTAPKAPSGSGGATGSVPPATTSKPATSPLAFVGNLDTPQKVGIGAGVLALVIGLAWLATSGGGGPASPTPGIAGGPNDIAVPGGSPAPVGPDGTRITDNSTPAPGTPGQRPGDGQTADGQPQGSHLPSDGNVVPGRTPTPGSATTTTTMAGGVVMSATGNDIASALSESGYDATVAKDNQGDPMIQGTMQGYRFQVYFYRCDKNATPETCLDLQFHASFTNDTNAGNDKLNAYNRDNRFGQAYFMQNGEIGLDMSATLQGGVSRQHIKEIIDWWRVTLTNFPQKLNGG